MRNAPEMVASIAALLDGRLAKVCCSLVVDMVNTMDACVG